MTKNTEALVSVAQIIIRYKLGDRAAPNFKHITDAVESAATLFGGLPVDEDDAIVELGCRYELLVRTA